MNLSTLNRPLTIIADLADALRAADIAYCHFKSNAHVLEGMTGDTDLDILVDRRRSAECESLLLQSGFKRFVAHPSVRYPGVDDWIGFDPDSGKLLHLHLHWQMVAGEPNLKGYRLPWEDRILAARVWNDDSGIYTSSPEWEVLLLLVRASLKLQWRDRIAVMRGRTYPGESLRREYDWLLERTDSERVCATAEQVFPRPVVECIRTVLAKGLNDSAVFFALRRAVLSATEPCRTYGRVGALLRKSGREGYRKLAARLNRRLGLLLVRRRVPAGGGALIAIVGADGSGKSTQVKDAVKWLGWKADVGYLYFGSGDGPVSLYRLPFELLKGRKRGRADAAPPTPREGEETPTQRPGNPLKRLFRGGLALALALEKRQRLRRAVRARNRGMIVLCDRFPQKQVPGFNDGPALGHWREDGWPWSAFARWEDRLYPDIARMAPDLVIKLDVTEAVSAARKPETPPPMIVRKIAAVRELSFPASTRVVVVDADQPFEQVLNAVRRTIWSAL